MVDRDIADRIIITSNKKMTEVITWCLENKDWLQNVTFRAPLEIGVVELREEKVEFTFETKGDLVEIAMYAMEKPNLPPVVVYDYDPAKGETFNIRVAQHLPMEKRKVMMQLLSLDNSHLKEALKYHALMCFMTFFHEKVSVNEIGKRTKKEAKQLRKNPEMPLPLIRREYVIENMEVDAEDHLAEKPGEKRSYTKPDHEVSVRGFLRHYKSGKDVWIRPHNRYKEKNKKKTKKYQL